ncbi:MAG: MurR/RpiR family transcriptional regulator [Candidatus Vecturithrix sp.]|nr:MurR/RpiR family transcriptional regulator [Candidatus Vecturithrix sp.]
MAVLATIRMKFKEMTLMQQEIAKFILGQPANVINMSITQLATATGVKSESSIVRFYRTLGFSGYHDFKVSLATEIAGKTFYHTYSDITETDDILTIKQKIFQGAIQTLHENLQLPNAEPLLAAVELLKNARRVIFLGYAVSGAIALQAFFRFSRLGLDCHFSQDPHINAIILTEPHEGDVIFCISHSGESRDVVEPVKQAKPPAKVIALTGDPDSHLSAIADVCIPTISEEVSYRTDVMVSRIVQVAILDTLYTAVGLSRGKSSWERLAKSRRSISYLKY